MHCTGCLMPHFSAFLRDTGIKETKIWRKISDRTLIYFQEVPNEPSLQFFQDYFELNKDFQWRGNWAF